MKEKYLNIYHEKVPKAAS